MQDVEKVKKWRNFIAQHHVNKIDKQTGGDNRDFLTTKTGGEYQYTKYPFSYIKLESN